MACGSVPNTNTFSLSDVITQVSCFTSDYTITDLQAAFTAGNLNSGYFDSTYEEDKDELNDFRNYSPSNNSDTTAPTAPTFLFATSVTQTGFNLSWVASTDNVAVTGYRLYRGGFIYATLGNVTSTVVTGQTASATNSWTLKAFDAADNESASSSAVSVTQSGALTSFSSSTGSSNQTTACGFSTSVTYYHDGSNSIPVVGDNVYSDSAGTIGLLRNHYFYGFGTYHIKTGGTEIDTTGICF